jgi:hypothetical protein
MPTGGVVLLCKQMEKITIDCRTCGMNMEHGAYVEHARAAHPPPIAPAPPPVNDNAAEYSLGYNLGMSDILSMMSLAVLERESLSERYQLDYMHGWYEPSWANAAHRNTNAVVPSETTQSKENLAYVQWHNHQDVEHIGWHTTWPPDDLHGGVGALARR